MKGPHKEWFYFAEQDLAFAKSGLRDGFYAHVCYLSQQAVEKALKGYLVAKGRDYPKTHGLVTLNRLIGEGWIEAHLAELKRLSEYYVPLRYPDALAGAVPEGLPDKEDAADALKWAEEIVALVASKL